MNKRFHESVLVSSPWAHIGRSTLTLMADNNPEPVLVGRVSLVVDTGAASVHLRPSEQELVMLVAMLQGYLESRGLVEVKA